MRKGIEIEVTTSDRARLEAIVADRNSPQKHVWRARIILATGKGCGTAEVMRRAGVSKPCVWRWQERFMTEGVDGLLGDKTRPRRIPPLPKAAIETVVTRRWLTRHPRWNLHFTPISCSWLNAVETLFAKLAKRQLKRGVFPSVVALQEAINHSVAAHNRDPKPFVWKPIPKPSSPPPKEGTKRQIRSN